MYFDSGNTADSSLSTSPWGQGGGENGVSFAQVFIHQPCCKLCMSGRVRELMGRQSGVIVGLRYRLVSIIALLS